MAIKHGFYLILEYQDYPEDDGGLVIDLDGDNY